MLGHKAIVSFLEELPDYLVTMAAQTAMREGPLFPPPLTFVFIAGVRCHLTVVYIEMLPAQKSQREDQWLSASPLWQ